MPARRDASQLPFVGLDPEHDRRVARDRARWAAGDDILDASTAVAADAAVVELNIVVVRGEAPVSQERLSLVAGAGIRGERRFGDDNRRDKQVTLVEVEAVDAAIAVCGAFSARDTRRNILTRGVALNHLVGRRFVVGDAVLVGVELCEPCARLARFTSRAFEQALVHRGGLRAEVVVGGDVAVGAGVRLA